VRLLTKCARVDSERLSVLTHFDSDYCLGEFLRSVSTKSMIGAQRSESNFKNTLPSGRGGSKLTSCKGTFVGGLAMVAAIE
jgi:hypothetical protein